MTRAWNRFRQEWEAHYLRYEFCVSILVCIVFSTWTIRFDGDRILQDILSERRTVLLGNLATVLVSLLGSMLTVASITVAILGLRRMKLIVESRTIHTLGDTYVSAICWLLFALVMALTCQWFEGNVALGSKPFILLFFSITVSAFRVVRVAWIVTRLIRIMTISRPKA